MNRYYIITKGSEAPFKKLILAWFEGINAIEAKDGNFILNEEAANLLDKYPEGSDEKIILLSYPLKDEKDIVFNITEETIEP